MIKLFFQETERNCVRSKKKIIEFIGYIFENENRQLEILNYIFCTDEYLLKINKKFLKHDYYTDIVTFNLSDNNGKINGEIYISVARVKDNARKYEKLFSNELLRVIFHGALHLCGYNDKTKSEIAIMRQKEELYLLEYLK